MKLSSQLQQDHDSGDHGQALEGYAQAALKLERENAILRDLSENLAKLLQDSTKNVIGLRRLSIECWLDRTSDFLFNTKRKI